MAATADNVISRVRTQLIDNGSVQRWSDAELLQWLSDGQREIVSYIPDASGQIIDLELIRGTRQMLPEDGILLLELVRNKGADNSAGRSVRLTTRELLDAYNPDWHNSTSSATVQTYVFNSNQPTTFYVYPPNDGTGIVEVSYSALPAEITALTDELGVADMCQGLLVDYVLYRAHLKDSDFAAGQGLAQHYLQRFMAGVDQTPQPGSDEDPNLRLSNVDPVIRGGAG